MNEIGFFNTFFFPLFFFQGTYSREILVFSSNPVLCIHQNRGDGKYDVSSIRHNVDEEELEING